MILPVANELQNSIQMAALSVTESRLCEVLRGKQRVSKVQRVKNIRDEVMFKQDFNMYVFWWTLVSLFNILLLVSFYETIHFTDISTAIFSVSNILVAVLVRNELILHLLYRLAVWTSVKISYGKYYLNSGVHYIGGIHASCATWGFIWTIVDVLQQLGNPSDPLSMPTSSDPISIAISSVLLVFLFIIILTAIPPLRHKFHDTFEISHRYLVGWSCLSVLVLHQIRFQFIIALNQAYPLETLLINPVLLAIALGDFQCIFALDQRAVF